MLSDENIKVAIGGLGAIGLKVAKCLDAEEIPGMGLSAVSARDQAKLKRNISDFKNPPKILPIEQLGQHADIVIELSLIHI